MPNTPEQQKHADQLAVERKLMRGLGVTREQARQVLHEDARAMREADAVRAKADVKETVPPRPPPPTVTTDTTGFEPRPLTLGVDAAPQRSKGGESGSTGIPLSAIYLDTSDGLLYTTNVMTDGSKDPV